MPRLTGPAAGSAATSPCRDGRDLPVAGLGQIRPMSAANAFVHLDEETQ